MANNDYISAVGTTKGQMIQVTLTSTTNLHSLEDFRNLVVKSVNGANVRLRDVAQVVLGADSYEASVARNGRTAVFIGIQIAPSANLLSVIKSVRDSLPDIVAQLPRGLEGRVMYDSTEFVNASIHEVAVTLVEALIIVMMVIFAFLGSPRSVLIPVIAIPAVPGRNARHHAGAAFLDQPVDAARAGARHRPGRGRCHHRGGERQPASRGGHGAARGRHDRPHANLAPRSSP